MPMCGRFDLTHPSGVGVVERPNDLGSDAARGRLADRSPRNTSWGSGVSRSLPNMLRYPVGVWAVVARGQDGGDGAGRAGLRLQRPRAKGALRLISANLLSRHSAAVHWPAVRGPLLRPARPRKAPRCPRARGMPWP
eukprot:5321739-Pyramimonas_sp.AAC.1